MNVFHRYTRQALRKNRSRTWVTIVGIILSVALFTAVTEGAYSGVQYLVGAAEYTVGRFHGCYQKGIPAVGGAVRQGQRPER